MRFPIIVGLLLSLTPHAESKDIILFARDIAPPELRADRPTAGKWWFVEDAKKLGIGNPLLLTGEPFDKGTKQGEWVVPDIRRFTPYRVPALSVDPKVKGWHRVFAGVYHDTTDAYIRPQLWVRLSREPYPEYLRAPWRAKGRVVEVEWKPADLTGQKIHIEQPPGPMPHPGTGYVGGIAYLRLVPMSEEEVKAAREEIELPPAERRLVGMLDYTDEVFWWGTLEKEDDVRAIVHRHAQAGFGRLYWRAYGSHLDNSLEVPEAAPKWSDADEARWCKAQNTKAGWFPYLNLTKKYDPLKVAVAYGEKAGCEVHAWVRFTNHNREPYAQFWHDHPEFRAQMIAQTKDPKTGQPVPIKPYKRSQYPRVLSMAYPEVRAYYVKFFKQLASTGTKGILIDLLRHPPIAGYEPIVTEAFKKKHGTDMEERELYRDSVVQEHLSQYFKAFLVELRKAIGKDIEIAVRSSGPDGFALRGKEWIAEGLIDTIIDGHWYSGNGPRPTIDATVAACGTRGKAMAMTESYNVDPTKGWAKREGDLSPEAILALAKSYSGRGVARFGLYESTVFTWYPDVRRAIRRAGWEYEPRKR